MPEQFDPAWEYWQPDPEIAELFGDCQPELMCKPWQYVVRSRRPDGWCLHCGDAFVSSQPYQVQVFCSVACAVRWRYHDPVASARQNANLTAALASRPVLTKQCRQCGDSFQTRYPTRQNCSVSCSLAADLAARERSARYRKRSKP